MKLLDADTVENMTDTKNPVITPSSCELPNRSAGAPQMSGGDPVAVQPGTVLRAIMGRDALIGDYFCKYAMNEAYESQFADAGMRVSGRGTKGEIRAMELEGHRFYVITLLQPQLASTMENPHPLVTAFLRACAEFRRAED